MSSSPAYSPKGAAGPATAEREGPTSSPPAGPGIDCDALLCALVLAPSTYSRNRFFQLYQDQEVRSVRRRAARLRSLVRQFVKTAVDPCVVPQDAGYFEVQLKSPVLGYERRTLLCELELSLFRYMHAKSLGRACDEDRRVIEACLVRLMPADLVKG